MAKTICCAVLIVAVSLSATLPAYAAAPRTTFNYAQFLAQLKQKQNPKAKPKPKPTAKPAVPNTNNGSTANTISATGANAALTINAPSLPTVNFTGPGTIDLQGANTYSGGTSVSGGPVIISSSSTAANQFTNHYDGANMTFLGAISLFENATVDNRITVNNTTTFSGGWAASSAPSVVINSNPSGHLVIAGTIDLDKPMAIQTVTVDVNAGVSTALGTTVGGGAIGIISNSDGPDLPNYGFFSYGQPTLNPGGGLSSDNGFLSAIKYTYFGEVSLVGSVTIDSSNWIPGSIDQSESDPNIAFDPMARFAMPVPEPSTAILTGCGAAALWLIRRRRRVGKAPSFGSRR